MQIAFSPEQEALRAELRAYFKTLVTPERRAGLAAATGDFDEEFGAAEVYREVIRQIGSDGWLGIGWPEEWGGQNRSMIDQLIFTDEAAIAGVPIPYPTLHTVGPTLMRFGTEKQKQEMLPRIVMGEMHFSIGYSEPESGTDLASLRTRARLEGDEWVINGQKMWTSLIQYADYIWLACRTDPDLPRHQGLSMIMVPADSPGFSYTPVHTVAGVGTSATYYQDVRVPRENLVGEVNGGWSLMTNQLNQERVALTSAAPVRHSIALVTEWARQTRTPDGTRLIDFEWVQILLGRAVARAEMLKLLNWQLASATTDLYPADASATKVYGSEMATEVYRSLWAALGEAGLLVLTLPEEHGGSGLGLVELAAVLIEVGRVVAPVPLGTHVVTAMALAEFGSEAQQTQWLPAAATATTVLSTALSEDRQHCPAEPVTRAEPDGDAWLLTGSKVVVPAGTLAGLFLVPATTAQGLTVFLVHPDDTGVAVLPQGVGDADLVAILELDRAPLAADRVLGSVGDGQAITAWLVERLTVAVCAQQVGTLEGALSLTAAYAKSREQFGRPIGTFQAVAQRLADGYIDVLGARLTMWQAAWRLAGSLPAAAEVAIAKLWAADAGHHLAHTTVHVHGGVGTDLDGGAHRYFTAAKRHKFKLGGTTEQALALGALLAQEPA